MRRISIRALMGLVLAVAVAFAALRGSNAYWAGGLVFFTLSLLGYALLASIRGSRAWLGFLVACGGYFLAIRTLPRADVDVLPTSQALRYIQSRVTGMMEVTTTFRPIGGTTSPTTVVTTGTMTLQADNLVIKRAAPIGKTSGITWGSLLPGGASPHNFRAIAHDFFALAFGWIGALVSRRMWRANNLETPANLP